MWYNPEMFSLNTSWIKKINKYGFIISYEIIIYQTPIELHNSSKVLPMYPTRTQGIDKSHFLSYNGKKKVSIDKPKFKLNVLIFLAL